MKFAFPGLLFLVALVPALGVWWLWLRSRAERRLGALAAPALRRRLVPREARLFNLQAALMLAGLALVAFAAARPQWGRAPLKFRAKSRNVVVALDVSRSMLAEDVAPNRLERAKADIADLIDSLGGDRCALVAFRRTGALLCPLTSDRAFLRAALEGASPESAARGETDIGAAIRTALDALDPAADDHSAVILISDGGDLRGGALKAAQAAAARGVPVFTVGLGDPRRGSAIPAAEGGGSQQYKGAAVSVKLEENALAEIAKAAGGRYVPLATAGTAETTLGAIYRRFLREVAAKEQAEEEELRAAERFALFLVPGILLLLAAGCFSRGRFAGRTARAAAAALAAALSLGGGAARAEEGAAQLTDREIWNRGVDFWAAGDATNALAMLRPLTLSRSHGARAAEVVGAALAAQAKARRAEDPAAAAKLAAEAAETMQIALRANPGDARVNRNFTRAADPVKELRENARIAKALKDAEGKGPDALAGGAAREARALLKELPGVFTNAPAAALARCEALARRADKLSDAWIALKQFAAQNVTNQQHAAEAVAQVEAARDAARRAAELLEDLDAAAQLPLAGVENAATRFWKAVAMPPEAVDEALVCQTNAFEDVPAFNNRAWQRDALDWTQAFRARFPEWAQRYEQQAQADTNKPPFTKEQQAEVAALAERVETLQRELLANELPPKQQEALELLARIKELLPKDGGGGKSNNQNNQNRDKQNEQQQKNPENKENQEQQRPEDDRENPEKSKPEEEPQSEPQENERQDDREVEALLRKAEERSKEHEEEKKARMRRMPPSPNERDW